MYCLSNKKMSPLLANSAPSAASAACAVAAAVAAAEEAAAAAARACKAASEAAAAFAGALQKRADSEGSESSDRERRVRELFDENGLTYSSHNKAVEGVYRPDIVFDAATHFVVVEVDENQHRAYPADVERSRMVSLCRALGRPTFFVRYNPDAYMPGGGSPEEPLAVREKTLVGWLKRLIYSSLRPRGAEVLHLFFDGYTPASVRPRLIV